MAQRDGGERSNFPIVCESCLGENPYLRMTVENHGKECKVCTRPFEVFKWRTGRNDARHKKTEICQTCCKLKNVCQVCLLDLEFGLPVQVRDTALNITTHDSIPRSDVNREYFAEEHDRMMRPNATLLKLQRTAPYYERNRPHVCSFYTSGRCTRGAECAYRHEMPKTGELSHQNIYGENDPVAMKLLGKAGKMGTLEPPEDESIKTLYLGGLNSRILEQDIRDQFYAYAFVTYTTRQGAEKATQELSNRLVINDQRLKLAWGRPQVPKPNHDSWYQQGSAAHSGLLPHYLTRTNL